MNYQEEIRKVAAFTGIPKFKDFKPLDTKKLVNDVADTWKKTKNKELIETGLVGAGIGAAVIPAEYRRAKENEAAKKSMFEDFAKMENVSLNQKIKNDIERTNVNKQISIPTAETRVVFKKGVPGNLIKDSVEPIVEPKKLNTLDRIKNIFKPKGE